RRRCFWRAGELPVVGRFGFELEINFLSLEIFAVIEEPFGNGQGRRSDDAVDLDLLAGEKFFREFAGGDDGDLARDGLPVVSSLQSGGVESRGGAERFAFVRRVDAQLRCFGERAANGEELRFVRQNDAQIVWRKDGGVPGEHCPADENEKKSCERQTKAWRENGSGEEDGGNRDQTGKGQGNVVANEHATRIQNRHDSQWPFHCGGRVSNNQKIEQKITKEMKAEIRL